MRAVIFGSGGQDGRILAQKLTAEGLSVIGVSRHSGEVRGSVADASLVQEVLSETRPDYIFHLAANSTTRHDALFANHDAISTGSLNVLETSRLRCPQARIFLAGSAVQFENSGAAVNEHTPFEAKSPYAIARIHSTYAGRYYRARFGMKVYVGYLFHHDSPMRSEQHVNQKIAAAARRIGAGSRETLTIGDLDVRKEFNFAGDVVDAIRILVGQEQTFEAVIGCGETHSIREWLAHCFGRIGKKCEDHVIVQPGYQAEFKSLASNPARIKSLGWQPKVDFAALAEMMVTPQ
jgi:GDPmannose 4,6-dehydratase